MPDIPEPAVQAAAEVLLRDYDSQYSAGHLTWRDFADLARKVLEAAAPALTDFNRDRLTDALTRLDIRVALSGPIAGMVNAESMADAIIQALGESAIREDKEHDD